MVKDNWLHSSFKTETISGRYARIAGFTSGFDYMRLILASCVVFQHSFYSTFGNDINALIWGTSYRFFFTPILLMFFALSGFLVSGSLKNNVTLPAFITLRALRLVPALAVEVLLSALVLGPLLTTSSLSDYFSNKQFFSYFYNIVGYIHYSLPSVFAETPVPRIVNISLWTVPFELECYLLLIGLWIFRFLRNRQAVLLISVLFVAVGTFIAYRSGVPNGTLSPPRARALVVAFLAGIVFNLYADKIVLSWRWALLAVVGLVAATIQNKTVYLAAVLAAYLVVYLGMMTPPKKTALLKGDYSYGLYLFAFPIQQAYTYLFPTYRFWYLNFLTAMCFGLCYAAFSWHVIEKPILSRKKIAVDFINSLFGRQQRVGSNSRR